MLYRDNTEIVSSACITFFLTTFDYDSETTFNDNKVLDDLSILKKYLDILFLKRDIIQSIRIRLKNIEYLKDSQYIMNLFTLLNSYYIEGMKKEYFKVSIYNLDFFKKIPIEWCLKYYKFNIRIEIDDSYNWINDKKYLQYFKILQNNYKKTNKNPIFFHINLTDENEEFYSNLYKTRFFKNNSFLHFNILHPLVKKFSRYDTFPWKEGLYNTNLIRKDCNYYSDKIAIDLVNSKIGKCIKYWNHSYKIDLNDENFDTVTSFNRTDIFPLFENNICKDCVCYSTKRDFYE